MVTSYSTYIHFKLKNQSHFFYLEIQLEICKELETVKETINTVKSHVNIFINKIFLK